MKATHQQKKKKKRRSRASKPAGNGMRHGSKFEEEEKYKQQQQQQEREVEPNVVKSLMEAFASVSLEEVTAACEEANGDLDKAAEILSNLVENSKDPSTSSVSSGSWGLDFGSSSGAGFGSSSSSSSTSGEVFMETGCVQNMGKGKGFRGNKQKRVVAGTGTVSTLLGKEYVRSGPRKEFTSAKLKGFCNQNVIMEDEVEQFLFSMLGQDCKLSMAVVKDVLYQCGNNVDKALDALLDLCASSCEQSIKNRYFRDTLSYKEDSGLNGEHSNNLGDRLSDCISHLSKNEIQDRTCSMNRPFRNYSEVLTNSDASCPTGQRSSELDLSQKVLESLFSVSKSSEDEHSKMNWRNVVKKMQLLGPDFDVSPSIPEPQQDAYVKGDEYHVFRKAANQHWDSKKSYYQKAATAYSKGEREYAAYLSDQGQMKTKLARKADESASQDIFKARNKDIENVITIDLHGQHVKQAMRLLKLHLLFGSYASSIRCLRVITGCGSHGVGKSKLKQSVIKLLEQEGIDWGEENQGTVLIKLDGYREFSFLDCDSDTE